MKTVIPIANDTTAGWPGYTFEATLEASSKIDWRVEDLIGKGKQLDFTKPFLPESLAQGEPLDFLSREERLALNQIRGHDLLKHHWMEECQHANLDTLMIREISEACTDQERADSIDGYLEIGGMIDAGLMQQVQLEFESLKLATGRAFTPEEMKRFFAVQQQAVRWTFLGSGMSHGHFLATAELLKPGARARLELVAPLFS
jgi:hypothetical protein